MILSFKYEIFRNKEHVYASYADRIQILTGDWSCKNLKNTLTLHVLDVWFYYWIIYPQVVH